MLTSRNSIVTPPRDTINIFRDEDGAVYFKAPDGKFHLTQSYYDVYRIENPQFKYYNVIGEKIDVLKSSAKEFIFSLYTLRNVVGGGKGGGRGIRGITVQDEGSQVNGLINTLNFEGTSVSVTDDGGGQVTITVGGGGMITGGGTVNRIAMFTPNGSTIGDSPLLRSGSDVIADGFLYFNSGLGIDVLASGGSDVLNIGTTNADVINYGYAGTTHNMNGTVFNVFTTNLNVTDKIITLNDGGAAGSGGNVGFEIEEGGVATGYFIQNTTRDGFDFQASAVTGVATFDLSNLTGNQTATLQDASGTIAYLSDIPAPVAAFVQNGNSFGAPAVLGTNDAFSLSFETSGTTQATIAVGGATTFQNSTDSTSGFRVMDADGGTPIFNIDTTNEMVGIGSALPLTPLYVAGNFGVTGILPEVFVTNSGGAFISLLAGVAGSALEYDSTKFLDFATITGVNAAGYATKMRIHTTGNVSIGSATDVDRLYIETSVNSVGGIQMRNTSGGGSAYTTIYMGNSAVDPLSGLTLGMVGGGNASLGGASSGFLYMNNNVDLLFGTNSTERVRLSSTGNMGLGTSVFGTNAVKVFAIGNGTEPTTSPADEIQIYSVDISAGNASLGLRTEQTVSAVTVEVPTNFLLIRINGTTYKMLLST